MQKNKKFEIDELINHLIQNKKKVGIFKITDSQWQDTGEWNELNKVIKKYS